MFKVHVCMHAMTQVNTYFLYIFKNIYTYNYVCVYRFIYRITEWLGWKRP